MELREMRMFVAVVEEGSLTAAARRVHISQPALSQAMITMERHVGVDLLTRHRTGVTPTAAGATLLTEARDVLARYDRLLAALARHSGDTSDFFLRIGIPLELSPQLLSQPLADLAGSFPNTRVHVSHSSTVAQTGAVRSGDLDIGLVREHPVGPDLDAALVAEEPLGVLLATDRAELLRTVDGMRLDALTGLNWIGFDRVGSPAWYDEIIATMRSHGIEPTSDDLAGRELIAEVKFAAVSTGRSFTFAPPSWSQSLPSTVTWIPLIGSPIVRRTWAVWQATSRRRDLAFLVNSLEERWSTHRPLG